MKKNKFYWLLGLILVLAAILRLRGFDTRFLYTGDAGRDLLTAQGAVILGKLPWVGNFSSAGPFVFAPIYYWFVMFTLLILPGVFLGPWLVLFSLSLFIIAVLAITGRAAWGSRAGLIIALVAATSPFMVGLSSYLQQHTLVGISASLTLAGLVAYIRKPKLMFAFLGGLGIGGGIAMHYQGLNLLAFTPAFFLVERPNFTKWFKLSLILGLGIIIPYLPLLVWDASRNFHNLVELIYYFRVGQYRFYVSNRWLTYAGVFWPGFLGKMLGGTALLGAVVWVGSFLTLGIAFIKRKLPLTVLLPVGVWLIQFVMLRYYHGEKFDGYLIYFEPLIVFIVGAAICYLVRLNKIIGLALMFGIMFCNIYNTNTYWSYQNEAYKLVDTTKIIGQYFGGQKVAVFGRGLSTSNSVFPLSYTILTSGLEDDRGIPIGVCQYDLDGCGEKEAKQISKTEYQGMVITIADLSQVPRQRLTKDNNWYEFSVLATYDDVQNWWRKGL